MADIKRITIKGESGYGLIDQAYSDKVTIESGSIKYEYVPLIESENNIARKWTYKTTNPIFNCFFTEVSIAVEAIINWDLDGFCTDIGAITFTITYVDKSKRTRGFYLPGDEFKDCFAIIKQMIPASESIPEVLRTSEDYIDEDEE